MVRAPARVRSSSSKCSFVRMRSVDSSRPASVNQKKKQTRERGRTKRRSAFHAGMPMHVRQNVLVLATIATLRSTHAARWTLSSCGGSTLHQHQPQAHVSKMGSIGAVPLWDALEAQGGCTTPLTGTFSEQHPARVSSPWCVNNASCCSARRMEGDLSILYSLAPPVPWSCRCFVPMSVWRSKLPSPLPAVHSSPLLRALSLSFGEGAGREFVTVCVRAAILSYSSSASAPNLDPIAFEEAALARLRDVAVSFDSGAARSTLAVALAVCFST